MDPQLHLGDLLRVGPEEQLQQAEVAQLGELIARIGEPGVERLAATTRDLVQLAPTASLLALDAQIPALHQPVRLGVELRVVQRPEAADAGRVHPLEVVWRRPPGGIDQPEDYVRGRRETDVTFGHVKTDGIT